MEGICSAGRSLVVILIPDMSVLQDADLESNVKESGFSPSDASELKIMPICDA